MIKEIEVKIPETGEVYTVHSYQEWIELYLSIEEGTEILCEMDNKYRFVTVVEHQTVVNPDLFETVRIQ